MSKQLSFNATTDAAAAAAAFGPPMLLPQDSSSVLALDESALESLSLPPKGPDGSILEVDFRVTVFHVGKVDTREQTSLIRMGVVFYWTDERMAGWNSPLLPPTLWGPELWLRNAMGGTTAEYEQFVVVGQTEGRMKRIINYEAEIITPMDLRHFPFDVQCITPEWVSISHWRQHDQSRFGSLPTGQSYLLVPVRRQTEGNFLMMFFSGRINEWDLHSYTTKVSQSKSPAGFTITLVAVKFYIARRYSYYLIKAIMPLVVLAVGSHLIYFLPAADLSSRLSNTFTMFLAAFALLYVVGEHVPRVDFLTTIDRIIFATLFSLLWLGAESGVLYYLDLGLVDVGGVSVATIDRVLGATSLSVYIFLICFFVLPSIRKQKRKLEAIEAAQEKEKSDESARVDEEEKSTGIKRGSTFTTQVLLNKGPENAKKSWRGAKRQVAFGIRPSKTADAKRTSTFQDVGSAISAAHRDKPPQHLVPAPAGAADRPKPQGMPPRAVAQVAPGPAPAPPISRQISEAPAKV